MNININIHIDDRYANFVKKLLKSRRFRIQLLTAAIGIPFALYAAPGPIVKPFAFSANTTAVASQVNSNFDVLYTKVNDNDARITALENAKIYREVLAMNDFTCGTSACNLSYNASLIQSNSVGGVVTDARMHMPDGAVLNDVWCRFLDNSASDATFMVFSRPITTAGPGRNVFTNSGMLTTTGAAPFTLQTIQASTQKTSMWTTANLTVNNTDTAFYIEVYLPYDSTPNNLALSGCYFEYTY